MLERLEQKALEQLARNQDKTTRVGIGLIHEAMLHTICEWLAERGLDGFLDLVVYTTPSSSEMIEHASFDKDSVEFVQSSRPAETCIRDYKEGRLQMLIRGQLPSSEFLFALRSNLHVDDFHRLALLSTNSGKDFFLAPVGIDEARDLPSRKQLVLRAAHMLDLQGIKPRICILSGGRLGDMKRDPVVERSISESISLVNELEGLLPGIQVYHGEILIESAIKENANVIIAPDGISGNLIYRTLIHLGNGASHGAIYMHESLPRPLLDTSRVGPCEEYAGAILLGASLMNGFDNTAEGSK
ncbi:methyltransferase [Candidatus Bathyarchaeota archaeon]|nr:methyltransferase [Candidatus Bathyarchaeota archaeon]